RRHHAVGRTDPERPSQTLPGQYQWRLVHHHKIRGHGICRHGTHHHEIPPPTKRREDHRLRLQAGLAWHRLTRPVPRDLPPGPTDAHHDRRERPGNHRRAHLHGAKSLPALLFDRRTEDG